MCEYSFIDWKLLLYKIQSNGHTLLNNSFNVNLMQQFKKCSYIIKITNYDIYKIYSVLKISCE